MELPSNHYKYYGNGAVPYPYPPPPRFGYGTPHPEQAYAPPPVGAPTPQFGGYGTPFQASPSRSRRPRSRSPRSPRSHSPRSADELSGLRTSLDAFYVGTARTLPPLAMNETWGMPVYTVAAAIPAAVATATTATATLPLSSAVEAVATTAANVACAETCGTAPTTNTIATAVMHGSKATAAPTATTAIRVESTTGSLPIPCRGAEDDDEEPPPSELFRIPPSRSTPSRDVLTYPFSFRHYGHVNWQSVRINSMLFSMPTRLYFHMCCRFLDNVWPVQTRPTNALKRKPGPHLRTAGRRAQIMDHMPGGLVWTEHWI